MFTLQHCDRCAKRLMSLWGSKCPVCIVSLSANSHIRQDYNSVCYRDLEPSIFGRRLLRAPHFREDMMGRQRPAQPSCRALSTGLWSSLAVSPGPGTSLMAAEFRLLFLLSDWHLWSLCFG